MSVPLEIPLIKSTKHELPDNYKKIISEEFANSFLESIHAYPTASNKKFVLKNFPLNDCFIAPIWSKDTICILPGMTDKEAKKNNILQTLIGAKLIPKEPNKKKTRHIHIKIEKKKKVNASNNVHTHAAHTSHTAKFKTIDYKDDEDSEGVESDDDVNGRYDDHIVIDSNFANAMMYGDDDYALEPANKNNDTIDCINTTNNTSANGSTRNNKYLKRKTQRGRNLSWCTVNTFSFYDNFIDKLNKNELLSAPFLDLLKPLNFQEQQLNKSLSRFIANIIDYVPNLQSNAVLHERLKVILSSTVACKLYGLLSHYCYWMIIHPCIRRTLLKATALGYAQFATAAAAPAKTLATSSYNSNGKFYDGNDSGGDDEAFNNNSTHINAYTSGYDYDNISLSSDTSLSTTMKEDLFLEIQEYVGKLQAIVGYTYESLTSMNQGIISCTHFIVDDVLTASYPWLLAEYSNTAAAADDDDGDDKADASDEGEAKKVKKRAIARSETSILRLELKRLLHLAVSDLIDPSAVYTNTLIHKSSLPARKITSSSSVLTRSYCTSLATQSLLRDSKDPNVRRFLSKGDHKIHANTSFHHNSSDATNSIAFRGTIKAATVKGTASTTDIPLDFYHLFPVSDRNHKQSYSGKRLSISNNDAAEMSLAGSSMSGVDDVYNNINDDGHDQQEQQHSNGINRLTVAGKIRLMKILVDKAADHYSERNIKLYGKEPNVNHRKGLLTNNK